MKALQVFALVLLLVPLEAGAGGEVAAEPEPRSDGGALYRVITYVPNRIFDVLDVARVRVRVGPGTAIGVRATEFADLFLGAYSSIYAGLPGPRDGRGIPLPVGFEGRMGAEVSVLDASAGGFWGPGYGPSEVGVSLHALLIGFDVGVAPAQLADLALGFFLIDLADDDF